jgi:enoyl-CoA hydratase/carnithine racemase
MLRAIMGCPIPLIAAVNGAAYGGGCEIAAAADFIYASTNARFALTEVTLGIMPGAGGTQNLPRAVGERRAKELGGCPFAPGATGNIDTEDTVFLLEQIGFDTGVDVETLIALRREVESWLPGERFSGAIARAGLPKTYRRLAAAA